MNTLETKERRALRPDAQAFDEVRIKTVPRYKTSEMSGDEWRVSASVEYYRHGALKHSASFSSVEVACGFAYAEYMRASDEGKGYFAGEENFCDQEGCSENGTVKRYLKQEYCREGHGAEVNRPTFRLFCEKHRRRGDCGLEDSDTNYKDAP